MHDAKLIWITPEAEQLIGKIARVSNPANEDNPNVVGLLKYLIKHKHWSPFEMASMCLEIQTTRAIAPQILRHRSFSFQEFSQRYAVATEVDMPHLRRQDLKNRQNSIDDMPQAIEANFGQDIFDHFQAGKKLYQEMLDAGVAKECARAVLPLNTTTRLYMSGTIRSWLHYIDLRSWHGTQWEHTQIALNALTILKEQLPTIADAMWPNESLTETTRVLGYSTEAQES
jgi:thymidylate synthase (FAD)